MGLTAASFHPLGDAISELSAHLEAATARLLEMIAVFDAERGWARDGCRSCAHWLNWRCGLGMVAAREKVRVAAALADLPGVRRAFADGVLSYSKVRAITRVATPESEDYLLMIARHGTAAHLEQTVRGYRRAHRAQELARSNAHHAARGLRWRHDEDGLVTLTVSLPAEEGERLIRAVMDRQRTLAKERGDGADDSAESSACALRADALMDLVTGGGAKESSEIVVHVSAESLRDDGGEGECRIEDGAALAPATVRRLACDAGIVRVVEDAHGEPLDVGRRTRSIPPALKRALKSRDRHCRFPGCAATARVEGHHIRHWAHGGTTALDNLVLLCHHHHRQIHEGGFRIEPARGGLRFRRPDGSVLDPDPVLRHQAGCPVSRLQAHNAAQGLQITPATGTPRWDGVPMDRGMAVEGLLAARGELRWPTAPDEPDVP